jgi:uncharacterized delta-60 repeat protein
MPAGSFRALMRRLPPVAALLLIVLARPAAADPGALDTSFSGNGIQTIFTGGATAQAVAIDAQDRILVAGYTFGANDDVAVARLRPGGALDGTFSGDGRVRIDLGASDHALDIAMAPGGKIVVVGQRTTLLGSSWFVLRLRSGGGRDRTFGGDGVVITDFGRRFAHANTVAVQANGKIVVGGSVSGGGHENWTIARFLSGGALDSSFGGDGRTTLSLSSTGEQIQDLVVRSSGILAVGYAEAGSLPRFAVAKLHLDGSRVEAFGAHGVRLVNLGIGADSAYGLTVQADGKPVLAGYSSQNGRADWGVVRLHAGGGSDGSFGGDGIVTTAFTSAYELAAAVAMQPDGRILVVGKARGLSGTDDLAVLRYRTDGGLNRSFSGNGRALFNPFGGDDAAMDIVVHDGKIIVVGIAMQHLVPRMIVLRIRMA